MTALERKGSWPEARQSCDRESGVVVQELCTPSAYCVIKTKLMVKFPKLNQLWKFLSSLPFLI